MNHVTQPGHFTNVYLESLQRATEYVPYIEIICAIKFVVIRQSKLEMQDCEIEDIEIGTEECFLTICSVI